VGTLRLWSADETTTKAIGAALAGLLGPGDVVGLNGDLGAGKTRLVQGAAAALGVEGPVLSPTFMLVREHEGDLEVHHVDAYRLSGPLELEDLGLEEVLAADAVVFVEWADRVAAALPESWLELVMTIHDDDAREIDLRPHGAWTSRVDRLAAALASFRRQDNRSHAETPGSGAESPGGGA
jgi:tRNA threonylcarbamoyladenosine biosynthesis protein TsaE